MTNDFWQELNELIEDSCPSDLLTAYMRDRPYAGQPQTDDGERGKTLVHGLTFRDVKDCFVIGCFKASGLSPKDYPPTLYKLPWDEMDPIAVLQNMSCEMERRMGIYPNVPKLTCNEPGEDEAP